MSDPGIRVTRKRGYTVVYNDLLPEGRQISARAWGVYVYLLGRPPGWEARVSHLMGVFTEGRDALYKALGQLVELGLLAKIDTIEDGLKRSRFVLDEEDAIAQIRRSAPDTGFQDAGNQEPGSQDAGSPDAENPQQVSTEVVSTDRTTTEGVTPGSAVGAAKPNRDLNEGREDVDRLCARLSERLTDLGVKHDPTSKVWRDAARLLMDADGRTEEQVRNAIDWSTRHHFWHRQILSMPNLRKHYEKLRLDAQAERDAKAGGNVRPIANRQEGTPEDRERIAGAWGGNRG